MADDDPVASPALLARPLSEILADATEAELLRAHVVALEAELAEHQDAKARLDTQLADERQRRARAEQAVLRRGEEGDNERMTMSAVEHSLPFLGLRDLCHISLCCSQISRSADNDALWKQLCPNYIAVDRLASCSNFKACLIASAASQYVERLNHVWTQEYLRLADENLDDLERFQRSSLRIVKWTITGPRLERGRQTGNAIVSPSFEVAGISDCRFQFYPGSKKSPNCGFFFEMPRGTIAHARVFVGDRSAWSFQHVWEDNEPRGSQNVGPHICNRKHSLTIQVEFESIHADTVYDWVACLKSTKKGC